MKKARSILGYLLFTLIAFLPIGMGVSACFGYAFELASKLLFALLADLLSVGAVILCIAAKETVETRTAQILSAILAPLSLIDVGLYFLADSGVWASVSMALCAVCCCYLAVKQGRPLVIKRISLLLSALMVLPTASFGFIGLCFGDIVQNTVVRTIDSPNGVYCAEVIDSDQGTFGGDTFVDVYENKCFDVILFQITKKRQRVYLGDWREYETMEIYWKDDTSLVINAVVYDVAP